MMKKKIFSVLVLALLASGWAAAAWNAVDTFDSYSSGSLNTVANPPWAEAANGGNAMGATINSGYLTVKPGVGNPLLADPTNEIYKGITAIPNTDTATTLYFRLRADSGTTNSSIGLTTLAAVNPAPAFGDFGPQIRVNSTAGVPNFNVRNGGSFPANDGYALTIGQWYNVWAVVHQNTDKVDVYLTTGGNDAATGTILYSRLNYGFRVAAATDLLGFIVMSQGSKLTPNDNQLSFDDIYMTSGSNLTIPEPASMLLLGLGGLVMSFRRKR
jgi:hypothetical protein